MISAYLDLFHSAAASAALQGVTEMDGVLLLLLLLLLFIIIINIIFIIIIIIYSIKQNEYRENRTERKSNATGKLKTQWCPLSLQSHTNTVSAQEFKQVCQRTW